MGPEHGESLRRVRTYGLGEGGRYMVLALKSLLLVATVVLFAVAAVRGTLTVEAALLLLVFAGWQVYLFYRSRDVIYAAVIHEDGSVELRSPFRRDRIPPEEVSRMEPYDGGRYVRVLGARGRFDVPVEGDMKEVIDHIRRANPAVRIEEARG